MLSDTPAPDQLLRDKQRRQTGNFLTGDRAVDTVALSIHQRRPLAARQADRDGEWRRSVERAKAAVYGRTRPISAVDCSVNRILTSEALA